MNSVLPQALVGEVWFTPSYNLQLIAVEMSTSKYLLNFRQPLKSPIHILFSITTSLQKTVQVVQGLVHNVHSSIPSTSECFASLL